MSAALDLLSLLGALVVARAKKGITQDYIASSLGVTRQAVSAWEKRINFPPADKLFAWAAIVGVRITFEPIPQSATDDCAKEAA
ncbi:helix-turn-helix protein [Azospirillum baldaniorum]|uniref:helix-turn-helix transcriptional regulator n=1 Tax=Azospirillum baldaniorum TaxID=1064539 RepID=UPI0011A48B08|nr:helix-turn-helix transcriptional regulator [Azospirillum baldaniorum]TWA71885.1 helix-turn-helix protein [Azospirillum baldaniorum]